MKIKGKTTYEVSGYFQNDVESKAHFTGLETLRAGGWLSVNAPLQSGKACRWAAAFAENHEE